MACCSSSRSPPPVRPTTATPSAGYAAAGIPAYLLIDREESKATLFTDPQDGTYAAIAQVALGKPLDLPAPFSFTLDTALLG